MNRTKELRWFALILAAFIGGLFGLWIPYRRGHPFPIWPWVVAAVFPLWEEVFPKSFHILYLVWMKIGRLLGLVNRFIFLGVVYYGIISPLSIILRIIGKDYLARRWDEKLSSYRRPSQVTVPQKMERPY